MPMVHTRLIKVESLPGIYLLDILNDVTLKCYKASGKLKTILRSEGHVDTKPPQEARLILTVTWNLVQ